MDRILIQEEISIEALMVGTEMFGYGYLRLFNHALTDLEWQDAGDQPYWTHLQIYLLKFVFSVKLPARIYNIPKRIRERRAAFTGGAGE